MPDLDDKPDGIAWEDKQVKIPLEVLYLRSEVARLAGVIEGMLQAVPIVLEQKLQKPPRPPPTSRLGASGVKNDWPDV